MKVLTLNAGDIVEELREREVEVVELAGVGRDELIEAGIEDCSAMVVGDSDFSVQVPVAKDLNPGIETVMVSDDVPDYVRGSVDLVLSTEVGDPETVADAVVDRTSGD
ncbi:MAG: hypothetical protein ABEK59_09870 [Halobacteria archaeon]